MQNKWSTLTKFNGHTEAEMAKSFLESHGINCTLRDRHVIGIHLFFSQALGGIRLDVLTADLEKAQQLLTEVHADNFALHEEDDVLGLACPICESTDTEIRVSHGKAWALILLWFISLPLPFLAKDYWLCRKCQHQWSLTPHQHPLNYLIPIILLAGLILAIERYY